MAYMVCGAGGYRVGIQGGYTGWGMGLGGYGRVLYRVPTQLLEEQARQRSGPRKPLLGAGVGGRVQRTDRRRGRLLDHPCGARSGHAGPPCPGPSECRLLANSARFDLIFSKVSQNSEVSPEYVHKACHSPYIQNRLQKSPLDILRFPYFPAFSHKELLGLF